MLVIAYTRLHNSTNRTKTPADWATETLMSGVQVISALALHARVCSLKSHSDLAIAARESDLE